MRIIFCCCILFLLNGCCHTHCNTNCVVTMDGLLNKNRDKAFIVDSFADEHVVILKDKGKDTVNAGCYSFYESGKLRSYQFIIDEDTADYSEEYDTLGNIIKVIGKPLTQYSVETYENEDSVSLGMYFFALNKEYKNLHITSNNKLYNVELKDDSSYYTNTKYAFINIDAKGQTVITAYWDIECTNLCTGKTEIIKD